jgi:NADH:ubiquinone oxidoreductase subunit 4 (subunit M)
MIFLLLILLLLGTLVLIGIYNFIYGTNHRDSQLVVFVISICCFIISTGFFITFDYTSLTYQFMSINNLGVNWIPHSLHSFSFGLDGISLFFVLLTTLLIPLCILTSWKQNFKLIADYCFYFILLEIFLILSFFSLDLVAFFISFESILIPMFFIIGIWGSRQRRVRASFLFFLYTLFGSIFLFFSLLILYYDTGTTSFSLLSKSVISYEKQLILWLLMAFVIYLKTVSMIFINFFRLFPTGKYRQVPQGILNNICERSWLCFGFIRLYTTTIVMAIICLNVARCVIVLFIGYY